MRSRLRYLLSDLAYWLRQHRQAPRLGAALGALVLVAAVSYLGVRALSGDGEDTPAPAPAPRAVVRTEEPVVKTSDLGFPAFATRNTTRVAGADPITDAAGVALATHPAPGTAAAVSLVPESDWAAAIAAASLVAAPVDAPILLSDGGDLPELSGRALAALAPRGSRETGGDQLFSIGDAPEPGELKTARIEGSDPAAIAAAIAAKRQELVGEPPAHIVVAPLDDPAVAMPAASWAARSGDPVLFTGRDSVPAPTRAALKKAEGIPVFVLGPTTAISERGFNQIEKAATVAIRVSDADPVSNAIAFARYSSGDFGWNINDPGHGFVIASVDRPADAAAAAALSASGTWGPLLLTDDAEKLPAGLQSYLLDLKPGYADDPTRAVYNHVWLMGDTGAVSVDVQAQIDELAELAPIESGTPATSPGKPEGEPGAAKPAPSPAAPKKDTKK